MASVLPAGLRLGATHLTVSDLDRSVAFYENALGLTVADREDDVAALGAGGEDLLVLHADPDARPAGRHAGLYHVALLYPSREELARAAVRLAATRTPIQGASDHGISEAIYLPDPDLNGIELAADRPRDQWPPDLADPGWDNGPQPLDLDGLLAAVRAEEPTPHPQRGLATGHLHLHVGDTERGKAFYRDVIGFEVMTDLGSAVFVAAGGYHHHLGFNVWRGPGAPPFPEGTVGLREWTVVLPDAAAVAEVRGRVDAAGIAATDRDRGFLVRDPWNNAVVFTSEV
jgi:catechol 2,3-dioxygenase